MNPYVTLSPIHTDAFSNVYVFVVIENALIDSRPHYRFARNVAVT